MSGLQYRDSWYQFAPPWLTTGNAEKYMYVLELCRDVLVEKMWQATEFRMPGKGDPSQLPYLANDRLLVQGPNEPDASFVARLQTAFPSWKRAGSSRSVLEQLKAYATGMQPGVAASLPGMAILGGCWPNVTTWETSYVGDAPSAPPTLRTNVGAAANWNWDGKSKANRAWLVLYMSLVATGQSGASAIVGASYGTAGGLGHNVGGVWVPNPASGVLDSTPFVIIDSLTGMSPGSVGQWLTIGGSSHPGNNGTFQIVQCVDATRVYVANRDSAPDAGPLTWIVSAYPWIAPGPTWGTTGVVWGQGESLGTTPPSTPPVDTGTNVGGCWRPTGVGAYGADLSFGLSCPSTTIASIRAIAQRWKRSGMWIHDIVVAFDGGQGVTTDAFSPLGIPGVGNANGNMGSRGANVAGVWVPTRKLLSQYDAWCGGTGRAVNCSVETVT